jgi:hypothetical protein
MVLNTRRLAHYGTRCKRLLTQRVLYTQVRVRVRYLGVGLARVRVDEVDGLLEQEQGGLEAFALGDEGSL